MEREISRGVERRRALEADMEELLDEIRQHRNRMELGVRKLKLLLEYEPALLGAFTELLKEYNDEELVDDLSERLPDIAGMCIGGRLTGNYNIDEGELHRRR